MSQSHVWYLHGAHSTARSFAWIKRELPSHEYTDIEYSTDVRMSKVLDELVERAQDGPDSIDIVGHSLGGVLAVSLAQRLPKIRRVVTLSAPFGGSALASMLRFIAPGTIMEDIHPHSRLVMGLRSKPILAPTMSIVTTAGRSPLLPEANDGVVSISSQKSLPGPVYIERPVNHFEVLLDLETARLIDLHLWSTNV